MLTSRIAPVALIALVQFSEAAFADSTASYTLNCNPWIASNFQSGSITYNASAPLGGGIVLAAGSSFGQEAASGAGPIMGAAGVITFDQSNVKLTNACVYQIGSEVAQLWTGKSLSNPQATGTVSVDLFATFNATYQVNLTLGKLTDGQAGSDFLAFAGNSSAEESVTVDGSGAVDRTTGLSGLSLADQSVGNQINKTLSGSFRLRLQLSYGPNTTNTVDTAFTNFMGILPSGTSSSYAGSASVDALHTFTYDVVSVDPDVVFTAVPEPAAGILVGVGVSALAAARIRRPRA